MKTLVRFIRGLMLDFKTRKGVWYINSQGQVYRKIHIPEERGKTEWMN